MESKKDKVLVADDVEFSRGILRLLLRHDYDVLEAANGLEAVEALKREGTGVACVLLDIRMPGMDGYGVMDYMRGAGLVDRIPVIALTAISDPHGHIRCFESGAIDVIEKPYDEEILRYKVKWNVERFRRLNGQLPVSAAEAFPGDRTRVENAVTRHFRETYGLETPEEVDAMFLCFVKTFTACADRLEEQLEDPDMEAVRSVTHDIFGFARSAGADDLDDLARLLNVCAKSGDAESVRAGIRRIQALRRVYCS